MHRFIHLSLCPSVKPSVSEFVFQNFAKVVETTLPRGALLRIGDAFEVIVVASMEIFDLNEKVVCRQFNHQVNGLHRVRQSVKMGGNFVLFIKSKGVNGIRKIKLKPISFNPHCPKPFIVC